MIKSVILNNFKSFKNSEIKFHPNMNVIVGPNGSGKSNIIDAISFVLGISSLRCIRAERLDDLIKYGEKQASVKISLEVDGKEYIIERTIERKKDGFISNYYLNGKKTTRTNILHLLSNIGISPTGHNIIMQGDITKFIKMTPSQRRQIIEEISGIKEYEEKKQKAMQELEKVNNKINEARIIYGEKKVKLKELEKEKREAEEYLKLKTLEKNLKGTKYTLLKEKYLEDLERLEQRKQELIDKEEQIDIKIREIREKIKNLDSQLSEINREIQQKGESEILEIKKKIETLKLQLRFLEDKREKILKEIETIDKELNYSLLEKEEKLNDLKNKELILKKTIEEIAIIENEINDLERKIKEKSNEEIIKEYEDVLEKIENIKEKLESLQEGEKKERLNLLKGLLEEKRRELREIENFLLEKNKDFHELDEIEEEIDMIDRKIMKLNTQINDLKRNLAILMEKEIYLRGKVGRGKYEIIEKLKSEFNGVYGTVEELIEYEEEYSLAIESSLGGRSNFLVVDSKDTAIQIINYLRENKLGRITIIPLDNVVYREPKNVEGTLGPLVNYVKYDPIFDPAMKSLFDNTYLIRKIEDVKKIKEKVRLVTLNGDLVETTGYFTGGYIERRKSYNKEYMKVVNEKQKIEKEIDELETLKENYLKRQRLLNQEKAELLAEKHMYETKLREYKNKRQALLEYIQKIDSEIKNLENEIKNLETVKNELSKELESLNKRREELSKEINKMKEVKKLREIYENKKILLENLKERKVELEASIKYLTKEISELNDKITLLEKKKYELNEELKKLNPDEIKEEIKKLKEKENELNRKLGDLGIKREKLEKQREELVFEEIQLKNEINRLEKIINDIDKEIIKIKTNLENLENLKIEDFERLDMTLDEIEEKLKEVEEKLKSFVYVNTKAIETYEEFKKEVLDIQEKINNLEDEKRSILKMIDEIETKKLETFINTFDVLNEKFKEYYKLFYPEGDAEAYLELQDLTNPLESGVLLIAKPPFKTPKNIDSLSGGEKTITALSFIFAVQSFKPSLFYILDEPEAALDRENTERMAKMIKKHSEKVQMIVISHNPITIKYGDQIIGVYLDKKGSSVVSLDIKNLIKKQEA